MMNYRPLRNGPSESNPLNGDLLNRQTEIDFVSELIADAPHGLVLAINGDWGAGKTWFVDALKYSLHNEGQNYFYINAWETDYSDDPFAAIASKFLDMIEAITDETKKVNFRNRFKEIALTVGRSLASNALKQASTKIENATLGVIDLEDLGSAIGRIGKKNLYSSIQEFRAHEKFVTDFKKLLSDVVAETLEKSGNSSFIFIIDELDRCRPTYAISMLEEIKHLFTTENVVFVISTNLVQLGNGLSGIYGEKFNGQEYLRRFFDLTYELPRMDTLNFVSAKLREFGILEDAKRRKDEFAVEANTGQFSGAFASLADILEMDLRSIEQTLMRLKVILKHNSDSANFDPAGIAFIAALELADTENFARLYRREIDLRSYINKFAASRSAKNFLSNRIGTHLVVLLNIIHRDQSEIDKVDDDLENLAALYFEEKIIEKPTAEILEYFKRFEESISRSRQFAGYFNKWYETVKLARRFN